METSSHKMFNPSLVIGIFLSIFGICVLIAIGFTPTTSGKVTNLICGLAIMIISGIFVLVSRRQS